MSVDSRRARRGAALVAAAIVRVFVVATATAAAPSNPLTLTVKVPLAGSISRLSCGWREP